MTKPYFGVIEKYRPYLNIPNGIPAVTLFEGNTPLIPVPSISKQLGGGFDVWVKFEGLNPTGSFKDRGMTVAISEAVNRGSKITICASTGNTAASAAAYSARAGMRSIVIIPAGKVAAGKLAGAIAYGADVIQIDGSFDQAFDFVVKLSEKHPIALVNSLNPFRLEGQKTAAFEICDTLGIAPDWLALPVGNAGNITAYWKGFKQYHSSKGTGLPRILGVQAAGSAPLVLGHAVDDPETIATAIRIGRPARGEEALIAASESDGKIISVSDDEILSAQRLLASAGIWVEPASAAGLAGLIKKIEDKRIDLDNLKVIIVCTGHGLKDPDIIIERFSKAKVLPPEMKVLEEYILND
jgi:threonine synthase